MLTVFKGWILQAKHWLSLREKLIGISQLLVSWFARERQFTHTTYSHWWCCFFFSFNPSKFTICVMWHLISMYESTVSAFWHQAALLAPLQLRFKFKVIRIDFCLRSRISIEKKITRTWNVAMQRWNLYGFQSNFKKTPSK